eukprot:1275477-Lingulodinium_polyedra.AAC.1
MWGLLVVALPAAAGSISQGQELRATGAGSGALLIVSRSVGFRHPGGGVLTAFAHPRWAGALAPSPGGHGRT